MPIYIIMIGDTPQQEDGMPVSEECLLCKDRGYTGRAEVVYRKSEIGFEPSSV